MATNARSFVGWVLAALLAGCGGSTATPADGGIDSAPSEGGGSDGAPDAAFAPPTGTHLLMAGRASLVGDGTNSCTSQPGATGDRWCAFVALGAGDRRDLWVFDATRVAAGDDVRCDGTDARCVRLSKSVLYSDFAGATAHAFQGDTLFYRAGDGTTAADLLGGPVWAWRPGWSASRELVTGDGTACDGPATRAAALCLRRVTAANGDVSDEVTAGPLSDGGDPLPVADTILIRAAADPANATGDLETGFSPDGTYAAWSSGGVLTVEEIGKPGTRAQAATDVASWRISPDGASWLWLRAYTDDGLEPSGTLESALFPTGTVVRTLAPAVADFDLVGARGVLYRAAVADQVGELRFMPDRAAPDATTLLDDDVRLVVARSDDARTVVYTRSSTAVGDDLYVWSAARATPCTLTEIPSAVRAATLLAGDRVVAWAQRDVFSQVISGAATTISACDTKSFGPDLARVLPAGDDRLLFIDGAASGALAGTLRVARVGSQGLTDAPGTLLRQDVDLVFAPLAPGAVVYTVSAGSADDGLYVYAGSLLLTQ